MCSGLGQARAHPFTSSSVPTRSWRWTSLADGYLTDEIYFAVAWVAEGIEDLLQALRAQGIDAIQRSERGGTEVHEDLLDMVMRDGNVLRSQP